MNTYIINVPITGVYVFKIEAESEQMAKEMIILNEAGECLEETDADINNDMNNWEVENVVIGVGL